MTWVKDAAVITESAGSQGGEPVPAPFAIGGCGGKFPLGWEGDVDALSDRGLGTDSKISYFSYIFS